MDSRFIKYIKDKKQLATVILAFALGAVLIFIGSKGESEERNEEVDIEEQISIACSSVEGVGACSVYVYYAPSDTRDAEAAVESVIIICEGADSPDVRLRLTKMMSSFFGIGTNRVRIEKMKS